MGAWRFGLEGPAIRPGQINPTWDSRHAGAGHVIRAGGGYRLFYWGKGDVPGNWILQAEADPGRPNAWRGLGPVLGPQPELPWNADGPSFPFVLPVTDTDWFLYFCSWGKTGRRLPNSTGVAVTADAGRTWKYVLDRPVLELGAKWDREATGSVHVLYDKGRFRMYYTAIGWYYPKPAGVTSGHGDSIPHISICCAESGDGIRWEKPYAEPLVNPRGFGVEPYEYICSKPCLLPVAGGYWLWVNTFGSAYRAHRLFSRDGLKWEWAPRVGPDGELGIGAPGAFDDHQRSYPFILQEGGEWRCWYTGNRFGATGMGYATAPAEPLPGG